ncbi:MAG: tetratricopeptide repeat protein [Campylobacterota bacterium]|nr:tetratricopeptide repeat protein [Campylobacterota bacterium]
MKRIIMLLVVLFSTLQASTLLRATETQEKLQELLGTWNFELQGGTYSYSSVSFTISDIVYSNDYERYIAIGTDNFTDRVECLVDGGVLTDIAREFFCWTYAPNDNNSGNFAFDADGGEARGGYAVGTFEVGGLAIYNLEGDYLVGTKITTDIPKEFDVQTLKTILLQTREYDITGAFSPYDFKDVGTAFDWTFTTANDKVYQLQGKAASDNDVFGWEEVDVTPNSAAWHMIFLGDWDGDGNSKYDWLLLANSTKKSVFKLAGVTNEGLFEYSDIIDIPYSINGNAVVFGESDAQEVSDTKEQFDLAVQYFNERNYTQAIFWYQKAADQGHANAQVNLAYMYIKGYGVQQNYTTAVAWYQKAANQGSAIGEFNLGLQYRKGEGVEQSNTQAVFWYQKAAEQGYANAQNNLAYMYRMGYGIEQNYTQAIFWYQKAADQGYQAAIDFLNENDF